MMSDPARSSRSYRRNVAVAVLALFVVMAVGAGCRGFFVNQPNSVAVTDLSGNSSFTLAITSTTPAPIIQLKAVASYSDGSNKDVTKSANWQSSSGCATVGPTTGLVTGKGSTSSVTITATLAGVQGSINGSVTGGTSQTLTISPSSASLSSGTVQFQALDSNNVDQAANATWTSSNTSILSFSSSTGGLATLSNTGTVTVSASTSSGTTCASGSASVTVGP